MRCSIIILSFALTLLAAPVPQNQALAVDKRVLRNHDGSLLNSRDVEGLEADLEARPIRPNTPITREAEAEPIIRYGNNIGREAEAEPAIRPSKSIPREAEDDMEARAIRPSKSIPREAEDDMEARAIRPSKSIPREAEDDMEARAIRPSKAIPREAEAEPAIRPSKSIPREAEAEPVLRYGNTNGKTKAGGAFRSVDRSERSVVDISLRDIYNSARGMRSAIVEALKGRGFNSANLLEPM